MRILYFSREYTTHDRRFLEKIAGRYPEVFYLRLEDDGTGYESRPLPTGVQPVPWAGGRGACRGRSDQLELLPELQRVLDRVRPDLVHAGPIPTSAFLMALLGARPLIGMSWGSDLLVEADQTPWNLWACRFTLGRLDHFVGDCAAVRRKALELFPLPDGAITTFPWGVEHGRYTRDLEDRRSWRMSLGWDSGVVVLSTRSWIQGYGIETVVESFAKASKEDPRFRLVLLGQGAKAPEIKERIRSLGLESLVHCPGQVPPEGVVRYMQRSDIYLCCTPSDGSSISLLEAMAMELPAVVTDNSGNREWVVEGESGRLVRSGDTDGFAGALTDLARHPDLLAEMGRRGRPIVLARADWDKNIERLFRVYEQTGKRNV